METRSRRLVTVGGRVVNEQREALAAGSIVAALNPKSKIQCRLQQEDLKKEIGIQNLRSPNPESRPPNRAGSRAVGLNPKSKIQNLRSSNPESRTPNQSSDPAFTLIELIAAMFIMLLLSSIALPLARVHAQRLRELELRRDMREIRQAIDRFKDFSDRGMIPTKADTFGYPPDLDTLVKGVELKGAASTKYKFLRKIPIDPMTGKPDWGMRSMQDDPDSRSWGGQNVFDIYTQSQGTALDGTRYADW